jgi:putative transposase
LQAKLIEKAARPRGPAASLGDATCSPLGGKLRDESGDRLTPTHTQRHGKRFRYYVSSRLLKGTGKSDPTAWRLPAPALDDAVAKLVADHLQRVALAQRVVSAPDMETIERVSRTVDPILAELRDVEAPTLAGLIDSVRIGRDRVAIRLDRTTLATRLTLPPEALDEALLAIEAPFSLRRRGIEAKIIAGSLATAADPNLHRTLLNAHCWLGALKTNRSIADIARESGHSESYIRTVVDTFSRYVPVLDVRYSYRGEDVVATLDRVCRSTGYPKTIGVDQGSEFVSRDMDLWAYQRGGVLDFSRPGKPTDNALIEAFNGRFRAECLNQHWFQTLADAAEKLEAWRRYYNEERPHGAIGNKVPILLTKTGDVTSPSP